MAAAHRLVRRCRRAAAGLLRLAAAGALVGCSTLAPPGDTPAATDWLQGRLALRVAAAGERAAQSFSAGFELRGHPGSGELRLLSPLGTRAVVATWAPGEARLTTPGGTQRFESLEALSQEALGEPVPLAALPDWLVGRPWPQAPHQVLGTGFAQLGWQVDTSARASGRIEARRAAAPAVLLRVVLDAPT